jgi:nucleoside-diphosphate-sugar epimerase
MQRIAKVDLEHILHNIGAVVWDAIRNKSIFVTGATGFFGKWILESFLYVNNKLSLNAKMCALSRNPDAFLEEYPFYANQASISFIKGDIQTFDFPSGDYHFIIHAATNADARLNREDPLLMLDTITAGTRRILDFAKNQPLESFLLTSSGAVYGKQPASITHIKEDECFCIDINSSDTAYAIGKRVAELYCSIYHKEFGLPVKIARCFAFVGPYLPLNKHFAIGNFILNALRAEDIIIKGDGTPYRSYMYAADLTIWLWKILLKGKENIAYNVGSDYSLNIEETAHAVAKIFDNIIECRVLGKKNNLPVQRYVPDISKAKSELNLDITIGLEEAIKRTKDFYIT